EAISVKHKRSIDVDFTIERMLNAEFIHSPRFEPLSEADAADHLFKYRLINGEFIFGCDQHHIEERLVIQASHHPGDLGLAARIGSPDQNGSQPGFVADQ